MDRDRIESWCQKGMLAVVIATMWFAAIAFGGVDLWARAVLQWLMVLGLVFFSVRLAVAEKPRLVLPPAFWAATLFMVYAVGRYWYADVEYVARQELIRVAVCYLVFSFVATTLHSQRSVRVLAYSLIALATLEAVYGIYQWASKPGTVLGFGQAEQYLTRGSGTFFNPNHLAGLIGLVLPLSVSIALISREPHWTRILVAYCAGVQAVGLYCTLSRGGLIAGAVALVALVAIILWRVRKRWIFVVSLMLGGAVCFFWLNLPSSIGSRFADLERYVSRDAKDGRELIWEMGLGVWKEEPILGVGPDHFDVRFRTHRNEWLQTAPRRTHNDYLQLLVDWGLVGASLGGLFLLATVIGLVRAWPYLGRGESTFDPTPSSSRLAWGVGSASGIVFLVIHSVVEFNLFIPGVAIAAAIFFGIVAGAVRFSGRAAGKAVGRFGRVIGVVLGLAVACVTVLSCLRAAAEATRLRTANLETAETETREAALRKALAVEPANPETHYLLGENLRMRSFEGVQGYKALAEKAILDFEVSIRLNRWNPYAHARLAICLDWLGKHAEAGKRMETALGLDPNNKRIVTLMGWHCMEAGDLRRAYKFLERATGHMPHEQDPLAVILFKKVSERLNGPG